MRYKMFFSICLLLASVSVQADVVLPQGRWTIAQVTIEKTIDGNTQTTIYNAIDVKSHIPYPQEWEIRDTQTIVMRYADSTEETAEYIIEGDQLTIMTSFAVQVYHFSIKNKKLILTITHNYVNNLPGHTERISEKWTIILKNKSS